MLPAVALSCSIASWFVAFVGYFRALQNTSGRTPAVEMFLDGFQWCVGANFTDTGLRWRRAHFAGIVGFALSLAVLHVVTR